MNTYNEEPNLSTSVVTGMPIIVLPVNTDKLKSLENL